MQLRGVDYGPIWAASGALGFFGEGYWFHTFGPSLDKLTFVAKTVTLEGNKGNMPLKLGTWEPRSFFPRCIKVNFFKGVAINAVGLSNFGLQTALAKNSWQKRTEPFLLSFMPISKTRAGRLEETRKFVRQMLLALPHFKGPVALQVNLSCPNTGENLRELEHEAVEILHILGELRIALVPKFNVMTSPQTVKRISEEVEIDGVSISNTIPYGQLAEQLDFERLFGNVSPLSKLGGGGLSGKSLYPLVYSWLNNARDERLALPINAGGGIFYEHQVDELFSLGAQSLSIASVIMLRPWRVPSIIAAAYKHSSRFA